MPVAERNQRYPLLGEPYKKKGTTYVEINYKGFVKEVRWYSDVEYARMQRNRNKKDGYTKPEARREEIFRKYGFDPTTEETLVIMGDSYSQNNIIKTNTTAVFTKTLLWHLPNTQENRDFITNELELEYYIIKWKDILDENEVILTEEELMAKFKPILRPNPLAALAASVYQGEKGDKLTFNAIVVANTRVRGQYGHCNVISFKDEFDNVYTWFLSTQYTGTKASKYILGEQCKIEAQVYAHKEYDGIRQTILKNVKCFNEEGEKL